MLHIWLCGNYMNICVYKNNTEVTKVQWCIGIWSLVMSIQDYGILIIEFIFYGTSHFTSFRQLQR